MQILAAITSIVTLIKEIKGFAKFIQDKFGEKPEDFLLDVAETMKAVRSAQTQSEKFSAARKVGDLIKRL